MTLFSVELELGPETRAMVERLVANTTVTIDLEFGPKTLATVKSLFPEDTKKGEGVEGLVRKGVDAARRK
jgi:hypothetical protein